MKTVNTLWRDLLRQVRLFPVAALLLTALPLAAQVPSLINYQGRLTDGAGNAITGNRTMAVRIYDAASGGNMTYEESIGTVAVTNGTYSFRFGSGGAVVVSANETIATTNGTNQVFSGTLQGTPSSGTPSLSDGLYSWTASGGSSNSDAFSVTYNGTAKRFQVVYLSQVPLAGRAIVATYQTTEQETIDASLANGEAYLALSVNGTEESTRTRLLAVPYALKAKESETSADVQALRTALVGAGVLPDVRANMVIVGGGVLAGKTVATFQVGRYEVTWGEWKTVRDWAVENGYSDLAGLGDTYPSGSADNFPVINVRWSDAVKWMNAKSEKEGVTPVYQVSGAIYKTGQSVPSLSSSANGYRLPTEMEWEWAARGGVNSQGSIYSGSNDVNAVAWYYDNSSDGTKAVGTKAANELAIHDMSGNVWEWCEYVVTTSYHPRGGSWNGTAESCALASHDYDPADRNIGFRLARSSGN